MRARVFVSCGQAKNSEEMELASNIAQMLESLGYDPYVAAKEQTLAGLKENIFRRLEESEYFLFVDFKRDALNGRSPPIHRGSLFRIKNWRWQLS
jgi:hypothetical protein